jgi:hypothetical protein
MIDVNFLTVVLVPITTALRLMDLSHSDVQVSLCRSAAPFHFNS